ncbi:unnamed protein product, partial [Didymodactylos carnosus]
RKQLEQVNQTNELNIKNSTNDDENDIEYERLKTDRIQQFELASKEHEISQLVIDTQKLQSTLLKLKETSNAQISTLESLISMKEKMIAQLEEKLQTQSDYDEIKRELSTLKSIEFSSSSYLNNEQNNDQTGTRDNDGQAVIIQKKSLELLLSKKNRTTSSENTQVKVADQDLQIPSVPVSHSQLYLTSSTSSDIRPSSLTTTIYGQQRSLLAHDVSSPSVTTTPFSSVSFSKLRCPSPVCSSPSLSEQQAIEATLSKKIITDIEQNETVSRTVNKSKSISSSSATSDTTTTTITVGTSKQSIIPLPQTVNNITPNTNNLEPLDTSYVASAVRKLLAQHNIGQRIFARYILSLSQGTVSELLSKPKTWQKLTEKGKESYRKMWCWANSEESILTLKSISPRKGMMNRSKDNVYHTAMKEERVVTEQKIAQILTDAQKQMSKDHSPSPQERIITPITSANELSLNGDHGKCHSPSSTSSFDDNIMDKTSHHATSLPMSKSFVSPLFLNKIKNEPIISENNQRSSSSIPSLLSQQQQKLTVCNDNYRNWLMLNEIVRNTDLLNQLNSMKHAEKMNDETNNENEVEDDIENEDEEASMDTNGIEQPLDLSMKFGLMDDKLDALSSTSSINDMNSDDLSNTQSLLTSKLSSNSTKPIKSILPPIREYDTVKYRYINTNELVQTIKDILSRYSISQRHFGERILGLSQGSVSDILARPKQWELLTQKGREPFIRMKLFLDDKLAVEQLIQNIPTTLSTTNLTTTVTNTNITKAIVNSSLLHSTINVTNGHYPLTMRTTSTDSQPCSIKSETVTTIDTKKGGDNNNIPLMKQKRHQGGKHHSSRTKFSRTTNNAHDNLPVPILAPYELPKVPIPGECFAPAIDTEQLSSQVRELLFAYSIGQRVFGEAVLNLSQGTVSEILSKPRPWHSLSVKGREPYMRMYTWYNDIGNFLIYALILALRRNYPEGNYEGSRPKRRCLFTEEQRRILKQIFEKEPYPSQQTLEQLVNELNLPMNKIANWFHNSRMRAKTSRRSSTTATDAISVSGNGDNIDGLTVNQIDDTSRSSSKEDNSRHHDEEPNEPLHQDNSDESEDNSDIENDVDEYPIPTFVPVTSTWLNGNNDADSSCPTPKIDHIKFNPRRHEYSTLNYNNPTITTTNIVSLINDIKPSSSSSTITSSSKKRKSVPQKIIVKQFNNTSI